MSAIHKMRSGRIIPFALVDTDTTQNNTDSPSFSGLDAGAPVTNRVLIAVITCWDDDTEDATFWPATCTIGGVSATRRVYLVGSSTTKSIGAAIYSAVVPNGATVTVDITVTFTGTMDDWALALFRGVGIAETPVDTDSDAFDVTLNTSAAKFAVFAGVDRTTPTGAWTIGGGNPITAVSHGNMSIGYDDAPLGGTTDTYDVAVDANAFVGAAFG